MTQISSSTVRHSLQRIALAIGMASIVFAPTYAEAASSWNPTLLVNTESFQVIDDGDETTDIELRFGEAANEILYWDKSGGNFILTDDLQITGTLSGTTIHATTQLQSSGSLSVDGSSNLQGDLTVDTDTFFVDSTANEVGIGTTTPRAELEVNGTISGTKLFVQTFSGAGLTSCNGATDKLVWNATTQQFECATDAGSSGSISQAEADDRYVNQSGDTMTGDLIIGNSAGLSASGTIFTEGQLAASGTLSIDGAATLQSTLDVTSATTLNSTLDVTGNATFDEDVDLGDATDDTITFTGRVDSNVLPSADNTYDLGGASNAWNVIYGETGNFGGNLTLNSDNGDTDAVLTFGNDAGAQTITYNNTSTRFDISDDVSITGALDTTGNITTDANLTINEDNGGADAVLTFGNDGGAETLTFSDTTNNFALSDDLDVTGAITATTNISADGYLSGSTLTVDGDLTLNGVTYSFPDAQGASGTILKNDGAGNLVWSNSAGSSSGDILSLQPEYANAVYFASGSTSIGTLALSGSTVDNENFYVWKSTKATQQDYWASVRVRIPDTFVGWDSVAPIQLRYKTQTASAAVNQVKLQLLDTANSNVSLTGAEGLASASWTTASITGPESAGTYTAGSYITVLIKYATTSSGWAGTSFLEFNWETTVP